MKKTLVALSLFCAALLHSDWIVREEFLSPEQAEFDCHSSSLVETEPGKLCAIWKGGPGAGYSNMTMTNHVGVWISHFKDEKWTEPYELVPAPDSIAWNPVLAQLPSKELLMFYRIGPLPRYSTSFVKRSKDGGMSWSQEEILTPGILGPSKNKPVILADGTIIAPSSNEAGGPHGFTGFQVNACWVEISKDGGRHWKRFGPLELKERRLGVIEPAFFYDKQGNLRMVCRDRALRQGMKGAMWMAISPDQGQTWSDFIDTGLPNPDSAVETVDLGHGKVLVIYNHSDTERKPLSIAVSLDGGDSWSKPYQLAAAGEFPAGILTADGLVHITFAEPQASGQRRIKHVVIDPQFFLK